MSTIPSIRRAIAKEKRQEIGPAQDMRLNVRVYRDEFEEIRKRAKSQGKSFSAYVRDCVLSPIDQSLITDHADQIKSDLADHGPEESFADESASENGRIGKNSKKNSVRIEGKLPADVLGIEGQVSKKMGHAEGCACFACNRLRELLRPSSRKRRR